VQPLARGDLLLERLRCWWALRKLLRLRLSPRGSVARLCLLTSEKSLGDAEKLREVAFSEILCIFTHLVHVFIGEWARVGISRLLLRDSLLGGGRELGLVALEGRSASGYEPSFHLFRAIFFLFYFQPH
jgi:hypothetical protein